MATWSTLRISGWVLLVGLVVSCAGSSSEPPTFGAGGGGGEGSSRDWFSDWRTGTGNGNSVLMDGGKWNDVSCTNPLLNVVPATGLGFPAAMKNVLRVDFNGERCQKVVRDTGWAAPDINQYVYYRYYFRNDIADGTNEAGPHMVESHIGTIVWAWKWEDPSSGKFQFEWIFPQNVWPTVFFGITLQTGQVYRVEWRILRTAAGTGTVDLRIFDSVDNLIATSNDFLNILGVALALLNPVLGILDLNHDLRSIDLGQSGQAGATGGPGQYVYFGGVAVHVSNDAAGWIGAYPDSAEVAPSTTHRY